MLTTCCSTFEIRNLTVSFLPCLKEVGDVLQSLKPWRKKTLYLICGAMFRVTEQHNASYHLS